MQYRPHSAPRSLPAAHRPAAAVGLPPGNCLLDVSGLQVFWVGNYGNLLKEVWDMLIQRLRVGGTLYAQSNSPRYFSNLCATRAGSHTSVKGAPRQAKNYVLNVPHDN